MSKIKYAYRDLPFGRCVHGTNFVKGDYIQTEPKFYAKTDNNETVELCPLLIRAAITGVYITAKVLASLAGRDVDDFRKNN